MIPEERRATLLSETEDVTREDQIFLREGAEMAMAEDVKSEDRLTKYKTEEIFGGIWIADKKEFAKFASSVDTSPFEEDGEGIAFTDNYFYAYYRNIDGQVIPYASVYMNEYDSQDVVNQVNKELGNVRKGERTKFYFDRVAIRVGALQSENNANNGSNQNAPRSVGNSGVVQGLLRKGRYYDNPSLYVKTSRTDGRRTLKPLYSLVTPEMDASYLDAVGRGDMETAQRMVMKVAKLAMPNTKVVDENGYPKVVYHGDRKKARYIFSTDTFFTPKEEYAKRYTNGTGEVYATFLDIKRPFDIRDKKAYDIFTEFRGGRKPVATTTGAMDWAEYSYEDLQEYVEDVAPNEYDGFILDEGADPDGNGGVVHRGLSYVPFTPNQIKSADPVTYDDNGNVIPLSERFSPKKEDIRYSLPTDLLTDYADEFNALQQEYESLDPSTIDYKHPFRVRKREVVQRYADHVADVLGLPCEVLVLDVEDDAQLREAYDKYEQYHKEATAKGTIAGALPSYEEFKDDLTRVNENGNRVLGTYYSGTDFMVVNIAGMDNYNENFEFLTTAIHENVHRYVETLNISDFEKAVVYEEAKKAQPKAIQTIDQNYKSLSKAGRGNEVIAYSIENRLRMGDTLLAYIEGVKTLQDVLDTYNKVLPLRNQVVRKVLNALKDGYDRKQNTGSNTGGEATIRNRFGGKYNGGISQIERVGRGSALTDASYSLPDIPFFDAEGNAIDMSAISEAKALEMIDGRVRDMMAYDYDKSVVGIANQAKKDRIATRAYYAEERRKRRGGNEAPRTNAAKVDELFADTNINSLPLEVQALIFIAEGRAKIRWADKDGKRGLASELGLANSASDKAAMKSVWNGAEQSYLILFLHKYSLITICKKNWGHFFATQSLNARLL